MNKSNLFLIFSENLKNTPIINKKALEEYKQTHQTAAPAVSLTTSSVEQSASSLTSKTEPKNNEAKAANAEAQSKAAAEVSGTSSSSHPSGDSTQSNKSIVAEENASEAAEKTRLELEASSRSSGAVSPSTNEDEFSNVLNNNLRGIQGQRQSVVNSSQLNQIVKANLRDTHSKIKKHHKQSLGGSSTEQADEKKHVTSDDIMKVFTRMLEILNENKK